MLLDRFGESNKFWKKTSKNFWDIQIWVLSRSSRECPENVIGTSQIKLSGMSLERQIRTSTGRQFRTYKRCQIGTSSGRQIRTSLGWSNRIFRGRPGEVGGGRPGNVLGINTCRLGTLFISNEDMNDTIKLIK